MRFDWLSCVAAAVAALVASSGASAQVGSSLEPSPPPARPVLRLCIDPQAARCTLDVFDVEGRPLGKLDVASQPPAGLVARERGANRMEIEWQGRQLLVSRLRIVLDTKPRVVTPGPECIVVAASRGSGCDPTK